MAATLLAVRCYAGEHGGRLPGKVEELVPGSLAKGLVDPFAPDGHGLRYDPRAGDPIVYSVDENGVDDHGSEAPVRVKTTSRRARARWKFSKYPPNRTRKPGGSGTSRAKPSCASAPTTPWSFGFAGNDAPPSVSLGIRCPLATPFALP